MWGLILDEIFMVFIKISKFITPWNIIAFSTVDLFIFFPIDFDDVIRKLLIWLLVVLARDKQYLCHHIAPNEKNCFCFRQGTICFLLWSLYIERKTHSLLQSFDIEDIYCHFSHSFVLLLLFMTSVCISCYKSLATFSLSLAAMLSW